MLFSALLVNRYVVALIALSLVVNAWRSVCCVSSELKQENECIKSFSRSFNICVHSAYYFISVLAWLKAEIFEILFIYATTATQTEPHWIFGMHIDIYLNREASFASSCCFDVSSKWPTMFYWIFSQDWVTFFSCFVPLVHSYILYPWFGEQKLTMRANIASNILLASSVNFAIIHAHIISQPGESWTSIIISKRWEVGLIFGMKKKILVLDVGWFNFALYSLSWHRHEQSSYKNERIFLYPSAAKNHR